MDEDYERIQAEEIMASEETERIHESEMEAEATICLTDGFVNEYIETEKIITKLTNELRILTNAQWQKKDVIENDMEQRGLTSLARSPLSNSAKFGGGSSPGGYY